MRHAADHSDCARTDHGWSGTRACLRGVDATVARAERNVNLAKIEQNISGSLSSDLRDTLGGPFFSNVRFSLAKIDLDPAVQKAISDAQAKFAQVSAAQADLKQAQIQAQTNGARQKGYNSCPACQQIDILKALPQGLTTLVLGNSSGVSLTVPGAK